MKIISKFPERLISKLKIRETFEFGETKEILDANDVNYVVESDGCGSHIIVEDSIRFPLSVGYWPFQHIILVKGVLDLSGVGLVDASIRFLPPAIHVCLARNKFISPNFGGKYVRDIDLSGNKSLISLELGIEDGVLGGSIDLSGCNIAHLSLGSRVQYVEGSLAASNNRITSVDPSLVVVVRVDLSNNFLTHRPMTLDAELAGNPVQPSDEFDSARW